MDITKFLDIPAEPIKGVNDAFNGGIPLWLLVIIIVCALLVIGGIVALIYFLIKNK